MKDLKAIRGRYYLERIIAEGEHEQQDFKYAISDARKIARSLSAFANHSGGRLLVGVRDNGSIAGVRNEEDIYLLEQAAEMYCEPPQTIRVQPFIAEGGAIVVRAEIDPSPVRPVRVKEEKGVMKAYYRVADENISAHPLLVRSWVFASSSRSLQIGRAENAILDTLRDLGGEIEPERLLASVMLSRSVAEDALVALCGGGVLEITHCKGHFVVGFAE